MLIVDSHNADAVMQTQHVWLVPVSVCGVCSVVGDFDVEART